MGHHEIDINFNGRLTGLCIAAGSLLGGTIGFDSCYKDGTLVTTKTQGALRVVAYSVVGAATGAMLGMGWPIVLLGAPFVLPFVMIAYSK